VAAGMIAEAVKSGGRSRHGHLAARRWPWDGERSATHADRVFGTRSLRHTPTCSGRQKSVKTGWLESDGAEHLGTGEHPALGPVPLPVPPGEGPSSGLCPRRAPAAGGRDGALRSRREVCSTRLPDHDSYL